MAYCFAAIARTQPRRSWMLGDGYKVAYGWASAFSFAELYPSRRVGVRRRGQPRAIACRSSPPNPSEL